MNVRSRPEYAGRVFPFIKAGFLLSALLALLPASCVNQPVKRVLTPDESGAAAERQAPYTITDYKNKASGGSMPEWVSRYYAGGVPEVEAMTAYGDFYVFIGRNEGNNFNALNHWREGFSAPLDFPRLAAARIDARFRSGINFPDDEYGAFYEALVRAASDTFWRGAVAEDNFWIRRAFTANDGGERDTPAESGSQAAGQAAPPPGEDWEFLILVTIEKNTFASQLEGVFQSIAPSPPPSKDQTAAAGRVKERFFEGF